MNAAYNLGRDVLILGDDSSTHAATLRESPIVDQVYGLQVAAKKTGSPSLIQASKDLQTALESWWANFSTSGIKEQASLLGAAIAKYTGGPNPLDAPPISGGVSSAMQEKLFDEGATGKAELAAEDVKASASERVQEVKNVANSIKKYGEDAAKKANTTLMIIGAAAGVTALAVIVSSLRK